MAIDKQEPRLGHPLVDLLARVRQRIRAYVGIEGIALTIGAASAAFWLLLAIDWTFEPPRELRLVLLLTAAAFVIWVAYRWFFVRLVAPLSNRSMAMLLERTFDFDESLLTAVEMTERPHDLDSYGRDMLMHTCNAAEHRATGVDISRLFNVVPLAVAIGVGGALVATVGTLAVGWPETFRFGVARIGGATNELWPRSTRLVVEGFEDGEAVVARGGELKLVVKADADMVIPDKVQIRYQSSDGERERKYMVRVGVAKPGEDQYQIFEYLFQNVLSPVKFEVRGGDARLGGLRIRVVESPTIAITIGCQYLDYMQLAARELPATAVTPLPQGCRVTVHAEANKDLAGVEVEQLQRDGAATVQKLSLPEKRRRSFDYVVPNLETDTTLRFLLFDTDGVRNRDPIQMSLIPVVDEPPQVDVQLTGIGSAVTPNARLPLVGKVTDDYGVRKAWITYTVDDTKPEKQLLDEPPQSLVDFVVDAGFEVRDLGLKPDQKLLVGVEALDNRHLPVNPEPNVGQGQRWLLDIVSPEQLRALLEARELNLRQRFESIINEMIETRDSLQHLEIADSNAAKPKADALVEQSRLQIARGRQNAEKDAQETRGVAAAFDGIYMELVNNRVDTEELKLRLKQQIAEPLYRVCDTRFPALSDRLKDLDSALSGPEAVSRQKAVVAEADAIVVELQRVRDKMLELETFNEAIDLLRAILAAEKDVGEGIKKQRSDKVRKLLEE